MNNKKIQNLLITHLQKYGSIELKLPDNLTLEIGVTQVDLQGELVKAENYCWVIANQNDRTASLDSYNLGIEYKEENNLIFDETMVEEGNKIRRLNVA
jgi:hypothetical protein